MKIQKIQVINLFFSYLLFLPVSAFALDLFGDEEEVIWRSGLNHYFKYVEQEKNKLGKNDHPVELDAKEISTALNALEFEEKTFFKGEVIKTVFSPAQMNLLGKQLAKGLKNAKPGQDIIFVVGGGQSKLILLTEKTFTTGRVFFKDDKLNIIIGEYNLVRNDALEKVYDPSGRGAVPYSFNYGYRSKEYGKFKGNLEQIPGVSNKKYNKKFRRDWIVIDLKLASEAYLALQNEKQNPVTKRDKQLEIEAAKMAKERREMRLEMARIRKEMKEQGGANNQLSVEDRLTRLEELKQQDLISESEYNEQRTKILEEL